MAEDNELPVWTIRPNWSQGILERLEWLTDVMGSTYGTEQRRSLRLSPRRFFDISFNPVKAVRSYFDLWLHRFGSDEFMVPLFHDAGRLTEAVGVGENEIPVDTTYREFTAGGMAVILGDDPFTFDAVEIDAVAADSITISGVLGNAWGKRSTVFPLRRTRIAQESLFTALTSRVGAASIQFELNQANDIPDEGAWAYSYGGIPILLDEPNRRETLDLNYMRQTLLLDNETGLKHLLDDAGRAFTIQRHLTMMRGREEHWAFRQMLYRLRGMASPIWLPTFNEDLELSRARLAADALIDIKKIGYNYTGGVIDGREHILLNKSVAKRISGTAGALSAAEERLTLGSALGTDLPAGTTGSFLEIVRLDTDAVEITHHTDTDGVAECALPFRAFRDERTVVDPIFYPIPGVAARMAPCGEEFSQIINLSATANCVYEDDQDPGGANLLFVRGVTIEGFDPGNILRLTMPGNGLFTAWSPWGRPDYDAANWPANSGSVNRFWVVKDGDFEGREVFHVPGPLGIKNVWDGYEDAQAGFTEGFITGASSYTFILVDFPIADNTGGVSIFVELT